ncbi:hypothetical protein [Pseudoduganella chitinolytica]|uniref:Uncharacterized protein n=1 Tax=Pseudoduganella chitinolytica TaxID=34070 RepID=A0ABY8BG98_9BURK|nr:hypothetical protein [Pseudoduganella chitinolytica]WEF34373.1 hypothetical protein PX653_06250 [Pseudoduganella chitinolytica]
MSLAQTALIAIHATATASATTPAAPDRLQVLPNGETVLVATVVNERHCDRDGPCSLRFRIGGKTGAVVYAHGDVEGVKPCGQALFGTAWTIPDGTRIEARGRYRLAGTGHEIDLCASLDAFLRRVR